MEVLGEEVAAAAEASVDLRNPGSLRRSRRSATRSSNRLPTVTCDEGRKEGRKRRDPPGERGGAGASASVRARVRGWVDSFGQQTDKE